MTRDELAEWEAEGKPSVNIGTVAVCFIHAGDRVQWIRAEGEFYHWLEQYEVKHAEFRRCIQSFGFMQRVWSTLADAHAVSGKSGYSSFSRRQSAMYATLKADVQESYKKVGNPYLVGTPSGQSLSSRVLSLRKTMLKWFPGTNNVSVRPTSYFSPGLLNVSLQYYNSQSYRNRLSAARQTCI